MKDKFLKWIGIDLNKIMSEAFEKGHQAGYKKGYYAKKKEEKFVKVDIKKQVAAQAQNITINGLQQALTEEIKG